MCGNALLASFVSRTDNSRYQNELYRNVDFLITNTSYEPKFVIEINDKSHLTPQRRERDAKVRKICEEAGIPIITLWTSYGVNREYIKRRINETIASLPVKRIRHFSDNASDVEEITDISDYVVGVSECDYKPACSEQPYREKKKKGCYIATCVYGSYNCPQVYALRRFRDYTLNRHWYGRLFIRIYYTISPSLVRTFGEKTFFKRVCKKILDKIVSFLYKKGIDDSFY